MEASQILPWYPSSILSTPNSGLQLEANQIPPWYASHVPSTASKRKMDVVVSDSEPEDDEPAIKSNMQVDDDATHKMRTTTLVSLVCFLFKALCVLMQFTSHQTTVNVTAVENAQPITKKVKMKPGNTMTSTDPIESKTWIADAESKYRSDYKNSDLPIPADQKWTNTFMDTVILWAGGQPNIWSILDEILPNALQKIFTAIYPDVPYEVTTHSAVFSVVYYHPYFLPSHCPSLTYE